VIETEDRCTLPWWLTLKVNVLPIFINSGSELVGDGVPLDKKELEQFMESTMKKLQSALTEANLLEPTVITDYTDLSAFRNELKGDVEVLLPITAGHVFHKGWRHSTPVEVTLADIGKPILRPAMTTWDFLGLEAVAALRAHGAEAYFAPSLARANQILKIMRVKKALSRTKVAIFGYPHSRRVMIQSGVPTNIVDPALIKEKTGVDVEYYPLDRFFKKVKEIPDDEVRATAEEWIKGAAKIEPVFRKDEVDRKHIENSARIYLGLKRTMEESGYTAIAGCAAPGQAIPPHYPPCFGFVVLKDMGVPCVCEADLNAGIAMIMLMYISGKPADMGNVLIPTYTDDHMEDWMIPNPGSNTIIISHSVTPTKMEGFDKPASEYRICGTHCSACYGINSYVELRKGQDVTIARVSPKLDKMLIAEGVIEDTRMTIAEGNRNAVYIRVKNRDDFFEKQSEFGNHLTYVYGRYGREMCELCRFLNIEPVLL